MSTMHINYGMCCDWQVHAGLTKIVAANSSQVTNSGSSGVGFNMMLRPILKMNLYIGLKAR